MKNIIEAYGSILILLLNVFACIAVTNASTISAEAKEYKAAVVAEIENSNFNPHVISSCKTQAAQAGYLLEITNCIYDEYQNIQTAEVVLTYSYYLPLFHIQETKTTRGIAR
ncbi:MAG: hypothetical protein IJZ23_12340 [Roseburia sp.]|nr:hypothetical protein [Roseburia sp.]